MAIRRNRNPDLEALVFQAAAEIRQGNPAIGTPAPSGADSSPDSPESADEAIASIDAEVAQLWESSEGQLLKLLGYSAAHAVGADRGE